jgi:hypothetical protein
MNLSNEVIAKYLASMVCLSNSTKEVNNESEKHILVRGKTMVLKGLTLH